MLSPLKMPSLMPLRTCHTKEGTLSQVLNFTNAVFLLILVQFKQIQTISLSSFSPFHKWLPSFCLTSIHTGPPVFLILFLLLSLSRPCVDLYLGELLQAWVWLTCGYTQDWDPHHRREVPGWCHTSCREPAKCWCWAVCYRWGRTQTHTCKRH